ncbi:MAG: NCS1 family nucleobase:cation symporter-1 [Candidatus Schekmanbacteria bacterium]|nr:NCS1 family nucleobase:cation symporter-1 [Candidatus Schekmanbacteria bacterium]
MSAHNKVAESRLYNEDLAPVPPERRTWGLWNIAALWIGMAVCIPTYTLAAGLISQGMSWQQALFTITLGNLVVLIPMVLNAHAGTKYGIPFPVLLRASFGTVGANIPALMRALVACGWFGIQTWIGGSAIYTLHAAIFDFAPAGPSDLIPVLGLSLGQLACFLLFWAVNIAIIIAGIDTIKWLETFAAPFLLLIGVGLLWWGVSTAGGFGVVFSEQSLAQVRGNLAGEFSFWRAFWPNLTAMVAFWATLSLNIPDFTRYARSQRDQVLGQLIGLPATMALYSFIGIAVTCATVVIFGTAIWDPVQLLGRFTNPLAVGFALFALTIATLSTNIAANVVSPANDFSNLWPRRITFKRGGLITGLIGVLIFPWRLYNDLGSYIFTWLIGYGSLLGAIGGVMIADYFALRRCALSTADLYLETGAYAYGGSGSNWRALLALALGIAPNVPGFLAQASGGVVSVPPFFAALYAHAWFVSFFAAGLVYVALNLAAPVSTLATSAAKT